jgi:hypothetical protein
MVISMSKDRTLWLRTPKLTVAQRPAETAPRQRPAMRDVSAGYP